MKAGGGEPEKKEKSRFSTGEGKKREVGKSLWNNEGKKYFRAMDDKWKKIYDSKEAMTVLYTMWDNWIVTKGKEIQVGDGSKTFHYVMGTWDDETEGVVDTNDDIDEDEEKVSYSSSGNASRHRRAWIEGELVMDDNTGHEEKKAPTDEDSSEKILFQAPRDNDEDKSSDSSLPIVPKYKKYKQRDSDEDKISDSSSPKMGKLKFQRGKGLVEESRGKGLVVESLATSKRVGKGTTAAGVSGGSPAANTRGGTETKRKR